MTYPSQAYQGRLGFDRTPAGFGRAQGYLRQESMGDFARRLNLADEERFKRMRRAYGEQAGAMKRRMGEMMFEQGIGQLARRLEVPREQSDDYEDWLDRYKRMNLGLGSARIISEMPIEGGWYPPPQEQYFPPTYKGTRGR